jgi:hypothetical protein
MVEMLVALILTVHSKDIATNITSYFATSGTIDPDAAPRAELTLG